MRRAGTHAAGRVGPAGETGYGTGPEAREPVRTALVTGALSGLAGGLVFGAALTQLGALPSMGLLLVPGSPAAGLLAHLAISALLGSLFGLLVRRLRPGPGETVSLGAAFGVLWWYAGPLTLLPTLLGVDPAWTVKLAQEQFAGLVGHLLFGAVTGAALSILRGAGRAGRRPTETRLLCAAVAGTVAAWLLAVTIEHRLGAGGVSATVTRVVHVGPAVGALILGPLAGLGYGMLWPRPDRGLGVALVRGQAYGFLWWVAGDLTLVPLLQGGGLTWSVDQARAGFTALPGFLLLGVTLAVFDRWFQAAARQLFSDDVREVARARAGGGLPTLARDVLTGTAGGLLFTLVTVPTGHLRTMGGPTGSHSTAAAFAVCLLESVTIGISFGQLFRHDNDDLGAALGWGVAYGFLWWHVGALTLVPLLLGGAPQWSAAGATAAFGSLIGHLAYGVCLGAAFHVLEARLGFGSARRALGVRAEPDGGGQAGVAASALSAVMLVMVLTVPIVLAATSR
jgi:uncharacterized membrane protein YagU involved in acid resistance